MGACPGNETPTNLLVPQIMPKTIDATGVPTLLKPGMTVYMQGATGEPLGLMEALRLAPEASDGVHYLGCFLPGVNADDPASVHAGARLTGFFVHGPFARTYAQGRMRFLPLHYSAIFDYIAALPPVDVAMIQVSPPNGDGHCSLGICVDFQTAVLETARLVVAEVNHAMPAPPGSITIPYDRIDCVLESERLPTTLEGGQIPDRIAAVGRNVAELIHDGDVIQIGIGRLPTAILNGLHGKNGLGIQGGMVSDEVMDLMQAGALDNATKTVDTGKAVCGVALGSARLYDWVGTREDVLFRPASYTHNVRVMAEIDNYVTINSVLEVDLFGQCNAEIVNGRQISGTGGLMDFVRGARLAKNGRSVLAVQATAAQGAVSRIVPRLPADAIVSCPRADVDYIVTEHGHAALRNKSLEERAEALIAIAEPAFRADLEAAWRDMRGLREDG
jgi:4-hydroxybutyrate CoA-transferase